MRRVRRREMEVLFGSGEALNGLEWPVAPRYRIWNEIIFPDVDLDDLAYPEFEAWGRLKRNVPLAEPDTFLSFARLAARGAPSEGAILKWVHEYGLLYLLHPGCGLVVPKGTVLGETEEEEEPAGRNLLNQEPMTLEEFRDEARYAYDLLDLYQRVRGGDAGALRERMTVQRTAGSDKPTQHFAIRRLAHGELDLGTIVSGNEELTDDELLSWSRLALSSHINSAIAGVGHTLDPSGKLVVSCPDLRTALYWQFACLVGGKRESAICEGCGRVFIKTRRDKKVCRSACRSTKSRARKKRG